MLDSRVIKAIESCAFGNTFEEVVEEYTYKEGESTLVKRKVTKKQVPPDLKAVKMLLDESDTLSNLSDKELEARRQELLNRLKELNETN